jgi:hypothetical protein
MQASKSAYSFLDILPNSRSFHQQEGPKYARNQGSSKISLTNGVLKLHVHVLPCSPLLPAETNQDKRVEQKH